MPAWALLSESPEGPPSARALLLLSLGSQTLKLASLGDALSTWRNVVDGDR